ncbi:MAG: yrrB 2 [Clostridiaceae bacterium]|jgi:tetratricopeptide (TPR) repeat protein|nr:yrrB 2 [Clostridiaceae bacterium]
MEKLEIDELRKEYFNLGLEAMEQKNYNKAFNFFTMAAEKEPIWPEALFRRAHMAYLRENTWGAAEDAVKALELDPSLSRLFEQEGFTKKAVLSTLNARACRQIEAKSFSLALPFLEAALKIDPSYDMALLTMAELYVAMEDYYEALDWLEIAVEKAPKRIGEIDGYDCYAPLRPYVRYGKIVGQEKVILNEARELLQLGKDMIKQEEYAKAVEEINKALEVAKEWPEALFLRGMAKYLGGPKTGYVADLLAESDSVDDLARALDYDSEVINLNNEIFHTYIWGTDTNLETLMLTELGISIRVITDALNNRVCNKYLPKKKFQEAISDLKLCIRIDPNYVFPYLTMAEVYVSTNNEEQAIIWLQKALEVDPNIREKVDTFACFTSLRYNPVYQELFVKEPQSSKSFYYLEMSVEPGGMREDFKMVSSCAENISKIIIARIKTHLGFYALLSYGQIIRVNRYTNGKCEATVDIHPFIQVTVPEKLVAHFTEEGELVVRDMEGKPVTEGDLSDLLFDYNAYEEKAETVILGDWENKLGELKGELISEKEEINLDGTVYIADKVYEF